MKLYRAKIALIARDVIERLVRDGDVEVDAENRNGAEQDLVAIMEEFSRRDNDLRNRIRDDMSSSGVAYDQYSKTLNKTAEEWGHPLGDDVEKFLSRQFIESMLISPSISEVFADDTAMYKKLLEVLRGHDVDEAGIREDAKGKVKNVREGTVEYEIALQKAVKEEKKRRGLIS